MNSIFFLLILCIKSFSCSANCITPELEGDEASRSALHRAERSAMAKSSEAFNGSKVLSVEDYGARGGGADSTTAFSEAWKAACSSVIPVSVMIPEGKAYLLKPITFSGPCKSDVSVVIKGTIEASSDPSDWNGSNQTHWILFSHVRNLAVLGGGTINGNGKVWWNKSCKVDETQPCRDAPTALGFDSCNGVKVGNLNVMNSQQIHVAFENSMDVIASGLSITAPSRSPNTDGIHVVGTRNITIFNCAIATGDDCISIVSGSQQVMATNITCGPGHGISIGSLGEKGSTAQVSGVTVDAVKFSGTSNGVRIKTWQGGRGYAENIVFKNIEMNNVQNPIIIDQSYCDSETPCPQQKSAVKVSNVQYQSIRGTSATGLALNLSCSKSTPCTGIVFQDINLVGAGGAPARSFCANAGWIEKGTVIPPPCEASGRSFHVNSSMI